MATAHKNLSHFDPDQLPAGKGLSIALVVAQWNHEITAALYEGAKATLLSAGVQAADITTYRVSGSFELIYGSKHAQSKNPDAVIAIGSVIQGATKHFDFVCQAVSQGIKDLNVQSNIPVIFCVLTDNTLEQAQDRSGGKHGNKGVEAAVAALQMADLSKH